MVKELENNIGRYFTAYGRRCEVVRVSLFSGVLHYGFCTVDAEQFLCGWIPCAFIVAAELTEEY